MQKKVCFIIERNAYYRLFAPVIEEMLGRGYDVFCFHDATSPRNGKKGYLFPALSDVPEFTKGKPAVIFYSNPARFVEYVNNLGVEIIISINYTSHHNQIHDLVKGSSVKWVALQQALDMVPDSHLFDLPDRFFFFSPVWYELSRTFNQPEINRKTGEGIRFCGFPEIDQKKIIAPSQVRKELGIPEDKPVVLYLSFQHRMLSGQLYSRYIFTEKNPLMKLIACMRYPKYFNYAFNGYDNENLFRAIRKFCDRNGAVLIVNGRQKSPTPSYIKGDITVTETSFYPADILKLLSVSNLCFNFWSTVVTECISMNVSNVCIAPELDDIFPDNHRRGNNDNIFNHVLEVCPDMFDYDGVTRKMGVKEIIHDLPDMNIDQFALNPEKQAMWIQKFLTSAGTQCSERIVSEIEVMFI